MKKIAIVTATRAEYGLLSPVIKELRKRENDHFKVELIVTGTHLSDKYGNTIEEIVNDGFRIDHIIPISVNSGSELDISENQADALLQFTRIFVEKRYSAVILLGDRYETLAIAIAAGNTRTPIFHLCGGDTTEGAMDEWMRHSITKISYLHFVTNEESRRRVIQLGEDPSRVYNFGSTSIDNILNVATMRKEEVLNSIGINECTFALCTYHPMTMNVENVDNQMNSIIQVIRSLKEIVFIVTKSNADQGGARINAALDNAAEDIPNLYVFASLGIKRYLSLMKYAEFVMGNSSSGIIETPFFHIPTVNIGDRQKGRLKSESVIDCGTSKKEIVEAIWKARSDEYKEICSKVISPYGDGHAAEKIAEKAYQVIMADKIQMEKTFYDINAVCPSCIL